jgi:hypothetical protein
MYSVQHIYSLLDLLSCIYWIDPSGLWSWVTSSRERGANVKDQRCGDNVKAAEQRSLAGA